MFPWQVRRAAVPRTNQIGVMFRPSLTRAFTWTASPSTILRSIPRSRDPFTAPKMTNSESPRAPRAATVDVDPSRPQLARSWPSAEYHQGLPSTDRPVEAEAGADERPLEASPPDRQSCPPATLAVPGLHRSCCARCQETCQHPRRQASRSARKQTMGYRPSGPPERLLHCRSSESGFGIPSPRRSPAGSGPRWWSPSSSGNRSEVEAVAGGGNTPSRGVRRCSSSSWSSGTPRAPSIVTSAPGARPTAAQNPPSRWHTSNGVASPSTKIAGLLPLHLGGLRPLPQRAPAPLAARSWPRRPIGGHRRVERRPLAQAGEAVVIVRAAM